MNRVCVLGLGYIGLPTASVLASVGLEVEGVDVNPMVVNTINRGQIHITEPGLKTLVAAAIGSGNLKASLKPSPADAFIIAVPTPFMGDHKPDLSFVRAAAEAIVPALRPGNLVILESTSPPLTTRDVIMPIVGRSGLEIGRELFVAHCPERVLPGRILKELTQNDRVIGGMTPACAQQARSLYEKFVEGQIHLTDATTAEMVKLMENTYRDVNIALANELALMSEQVGISAWEVRRLANLHPRVSLHLPGPGVGGHCISVDPWFLVDSFPEHAKIVKAARDLNNSVPHRVVSRITAAISDTHDPRVTVLGLSYKANIDDLRESPAVEIASQLISNGVEVRAYDPHVREWDHELSTLEAAFAGSDIVALLTDHEEFKHLNPQTLGPLMRRRKLIDTRACLDLALWERAGFETSLLGSSLHGNLSPAPRTHVSALGGVSR